jgi:hypothetical protein
MSTNNASFFKSQSLLLKRNLKLLSSGVGGPSGPGGQTIRDSARGNCWCTYPCVLVRTIQPGLADHPHVPKWIWAGTVCFMSLYYGLSGAFAQTTRGLRADSSAMVGRQSARVVQYSQCSSISYWQVPDRSGLTFSGSTDRFQTGIIAVTGTADRPAIGRRLSACMQNMS